MVGLPTILVLWLVWLPALGSVLLSFTSWDGSGGLRHRVGRLKNYHDIVNIYPPFWPAIQHNLIWFAVFFLIATPLGMFLAVLLDREMRGSRFYQTAFYLPVVLSWPSSASSGSSSTRRDQGLINEVLGRHDRLARRPERQPVGRPREATGATSATSCCSTWPA